MEDNNIENADNAQDPQMAKWLEEIKSNPAIEQYLSQFLPDSAETFITSYLKAKKDWHQYGPAYLEESEQKSIRWIAAASEHLPVILQKKLFDAQCLWRAEQLDIAEITVCSEFNQWEDNILNCPFIEPITEGDIALYQSFLLQLPSDTDRYFFEEWQDYEELKKAYRDDRDARDFPDWYDFCNMCKGTTALMMLPDVRGEKEEFYLKLWRAERQRIAGEEGEAQNEAKDKRPSIYFYGGNELETFVARFENAETKRLYKSYNYFNRQMNHREDLEWELDILFEAEEIIPIQADADWKTAIINTARDYERRKIAEALPEAWEQYQMNIDLGIGFPGRNESALGSIADMYKKMILRGRVLNGEHEDFNF
jgi:hypothetical protein